MKLRVLITCADCGEQHHIHVLGGWDIARVVHRCREKDLGVLRSNGQELRIGEFGVTFKPPRRTF